MEYKWRGDLSSCLRYSPTQAMNSAFKAWYLRLFGRPREDVSSPDSSRLPAAAAGATALTVSFHLHFTANFPQSAATAGTESTPYE